MSLPLEQDENNKERRDLKYVSIIVKECKELSRLQAQRYNMGIFQDSLRDIAN